jgi:hypothetical protein
MRRYLRGAGNAAGRGPAFGGYQPALAGIAVGAGVVAVAFLVLGVLAFRSATHTASQVSQPTYTETGAFDYAIEMEPSTLYPDGILRPPAESGSDPLQNGEEGSSPAPAFTALAREARVTFQYKLASSEAAELSGTVAADLVIRPEGREWVRTTELLAPRAFTGTSVDQSLTIDLLAVGALIAQISEETALSGGTFEVVVVARVEGAGTRAGEPLAVLFEQPFTLRYDRTLITPPAERTMTVQASSSELVTNSKSLSLVLWSPSVSAARALSVVGFVTALGALVVFGGYLALGLSSSEEARIRARYGSRLVDVRGAESGPEDDAVRVASMRDLSRLAERFGSVILHQPMPAGHRYFVRDGDDTYEYVIASAATSGPFGAGSPVDTAGS